MKNSFIIDRARYDQLAVRYEDKFAGIPGSVAQYLDFFIVEEEDGSAFLIKNRHNSKPRMSYIEYKAFKITKFYEGD